jgi:hypothetical protein
MIETEAFSPETETVTFPNEPFEASGKVRFCNYERGYCILDFKLPTDGSSRSCMLAQKNLRGPNGGHFCCLRQNDLLSLVILEKQPGRFYATEAYTSFEIEGLAEEEISQVTFIDPVKHWRVFVKRVVPNCGCGLLLWTKENDPNLRVGDYIRHKTVPTDNGDGRAHGEDISLLSKEQIKDLNLETGKE